MPKIKLIQSQRSLPENAGNAYVDDKSGQIIGNAVQDLGNTLRVIEENTSKKKASVSMFEAKNELMEMSRLSYTDAVENKRGQLALPDEESGAAGVYGDYDKQANDFISEKIGRIDPRYQDAAREQLEGVANRYRDRFMGYQAQQGAEHRKAVLHGNIAQMEDELKMSMASGGGIEDIDFVYQDIAEMTKDNAKGANVTEFLGAKKASLYEQSITAATANFPEQALEILDDKKAIKALDPAVRERLKAGAKKQVLIKSANQHIDAISNSGLTDDGKIGLVADMPDKTPEQREVRDTVSREINYQISQQAKADSIAQSDLVGDVYEEIFDAQDGQEPITPAMVDADPRFDILEPNQKLMIKSWLGGGKAGQFDETNRAIMWDDARIKVIKGEWDEKDLRDNIGVGYDVRDFKGLVNMVVKEKTNPMTSGLVDELFQSFHERQYNNKKSRARIDQGVFMDIQEFKKVNSTYPNREQVKKMLDDNAVGYVEKQWFDSQYVDRMQDTYSSIDEPQYKYIEDDDKGERLSYTQREVFRFRDERGFPEALYLSAENAFILGEKDGRFWVSEGGRMYSRPIDDPVVKAYKSLLSK